MLDEVNVTTRVECNCSFCTLFGFPLSIIDFRIFYFIFFISSYNFYFYFIYLFYFIIIIFYIFSVSICIVFIVILARSRLNKSCTHPCNVDK